MVKQRVISLLALCASFFALCVIALGAFTRLIDAGLGCPDWPGCYGQMTVPSSEHVLQLLQGSNAHFVAYKAWAEMIHRYFAGSLSTLILVIVILILFTRCPSMSRLSGACSRDSEDESTGQAGVVADFQQPSSGLLSGSKRSFLKIRNGVTQWFFFLRAKREKKELLWQDPSHPPGGRLHAAPKIYNNAGQATSRRVNVILAIMLVAAVCYQIILGQLTVTLKLLPVIVTQHLLGGFLILSLLWLIYLNNRCYSSSALQGQNFQVNSKIYLSLACIALILVISQIALGAWTSTNYASLSCKDFPLCQNELTAFTWHFKQAFNIFSPIGINYEGGVLPEEVRQTIQMSHRMGAMILTIYMLIFTAITVPKLSQSIYFMKSIYIIWGLLIMQLCIGMANIIFKLPLVTAIAHTLVAVLLLLAVITLVYKLAAAQYKGSMQ